MTQEQRLIALAEAVGLDIKNININLATLNNAMPVITAGTAAPSGGNDGDIYLQYV